MDLFRYLNAIRSLDDVLVELRWRMGKEHVLTGNYSWPLPEHLRSELAIIWPTTYNWGQADKWMRHFLVGFTNAIPVMRRTIPQEPYLEGTVVLDVSYREEMYRVAIDFSDDMDHICPRALAEATVYYKMQYRREGYGEDTIVPGGYPLCSPDSYRFLSKLRHDSDVKEKLYTIYGRFGLRYSTVLRQKAVTLLSEDRDLRYKGGHDFVRYSRYLREVARSKIGIDLPGNGDFCFRLIDYLSIGICVIGPKPRTEFPVPLRDGEQIVYCKDDLTDLVPLCHRYLADDQECNRIARNARDYFDRYLHRDQLTRYYLNQFVRCVG
jgi:hypothetical protein